RQGRYKDVAGNLKVKEVRIADDERFVICHNPEAAERDAETRARLIAQLKELTGGSDKLGRDKRAELRGVISTKPGLNRYLRVTPGGLLRIDASRAKAERGWRDMKQVIDLRPVYHRKEERIRAHVILCWLALLLIRIAESAAGTTWNKIADELSLLTLGTFTGPDGTFRQTAELTRGPRGILA